MPAAAPLTGTGTTITFAGLGTTFRVISCSFSGWERKAIQTTYMGTTTAHTFIPGDLQDPGELTLDVQFPQDGDMSTLMAAAAETITVKFRGSTTHSMSASGFVRSCSVAVPVDDLMTSTIVVKFTGPMSDTNT